ncbi:MAG: hypothetical protein LBC97_16790, partial [Bifidobacteriaceae bacterium]|nr:hypothetical protein [Bifidobacteriaceae bacterium]
MKYRKLPQFQRDWRSLPARERALVKAWLRDEFLPAAAAWPKNLRFEGITSAPGVYAVTWSFAGPDGRATFHFEEIG